jgi:hypothetical protein
MSCAGDARRVDVAAAKARENSPTRVERSWAAVGDSLRRVMTGEDQPMPKPPPPDVGWELETVRDGVSAICVVPLMFGLTLLALVVLFGR